MSPRSAAVWFVFLFAIAAPAFAAGKSNNPRTPVEEFLSSPVPVQLPKLVATWDSAVRRALRTSPDISNVAARLAPRFGLERESMTTLMTFWLKSTILYWDDSQPEAAKESAHRALDDDFIGLVRRTRHQSLALAVAVQAITGIGRCIPETYKSLMAGAPDLPATAWRIANSTYCVSWVAAFTELAPQKAAAAEVALALEGDQLTIPQQLAITELLGADTLKTHVSEVDLVTLQNRFAHDHLVRLFDAGFVQEGLAFFEGLPASTRSALTNPGATTAPTVHVDGLPISLPKSQESLAADIVAARYVVGMNGIGSDGLVSVAQIQSTRAMLQCSHNFTPSRDLPRSRCGKSPNSARKEALLDLAVLRPSADPYDYLEFYYLGEQGTESGPSTGSGLWTQALCRRIGQTHYAQVCQTAREQLDPWYERRFRDPGDEVEETTARATVNRLGGRALASLEATYAQKLTATYGPDPGLHPLERPQDEASGGPLPSPFNENPMPEAYRAVLADESTNQPDDRWSSELAVLPRGYSPVRIERSGDRIVAISISQNLDPSGEVSSGGYWVHVSQDAGKSWQPPMYTGLAERFPYVVRAHSKMPMLDGDSLNLEVDIQELDTSSITYPPVALRSKRRAANLYLHIPLSVLRQDSDGDGIPDIVETHLLLDPHNADSDGDGITDGQDSMPNVGRIREHHPGDGALGAALEALFHVRVGALVEGIDHPTGSDAITAELAQVRPATALPYDHPIFIEGDPADFSSLNPGGLVLVYTPSQLKQLRRMTPDFHAVSFSHLELNDNQDRGYLMWNAGWEGGAFRLVRKGQNWSAVEMYRWIS